MLWGVGPVTAEKLHDHGIDTVGDLAASGRAELQGYLGPHAGRHLRDLAHNLDPRAVDTHRRDRSMGAQRALGNRIRTREELRRELLALAEKVAARLRKAERVARTVTVAIAPRRCATKAAPAPSSSPPIAQACSPRSPMNCSSTSSTAPMAPGAGSAARVAP